MKRGRRELCPEHRRLAAALARPHSQTISATDDSTGATDQTSTATLTHKATQVVAEIIGNHQTRRIITLDIPVTTDCLELHLLVPSTTSPAAFFAVRCFS